MLHLQVLLAGLVFSFLGSIPPGTLNLIVLHLGLQNKTAVALRFALAVAIVEYPYVWIAVKFEDWITSSPVVTENFQLITAIVMTTLGILMWWSVRKPTAFSARFNESGFRRGIVLSILNPMNIPYWIGITAYLRAQGWIELSTIGSVQSYIVGASLGVMLLLVCFTFMAAKLSPYVQQNRFVKMLPALMLLGLGLYAFAKYLI